MNPLKTQNCLCGFLFAEKNETQIVVGVGVCRTDLQCLAKFLFRLVQVALHRVEVAQVIADSRGFRIDFQSLVEGVKGIGVVLLCRVDKAKQSIAFGARRILLNFLLECSPGFFKFALLKKSFRVREGRWLCGCRMGWCGMARLLLCRCTLSSDR